MKELYTEIEIDAPISKVWSVLVDFESYKDWNPFIISLEGELKLDNQLKAKIQPPDGSMMKFKPVVTGLEVGKSFDWTGKLFFKGLFDGNHFFELEDLGDDKTKMVQREQFSGMLVNSFWKTLDTKTRKGFEMMNEKVKALSEAP